MATTNSPHTRALTIHTPANQLLPLPLRRHRLPQTARQLKQQHPHPLTHPRPIPRVAAVAIAANRRAHIIISSKLHRTSTPITLNHTLITHNRRYDNIGHLHSSNDLQIPRYNDHSSLAVSSTSASSTGQLVQQRPLLTLLSALLRHPRFCLQPVTPSD